MSTPLSNDLRQRIIAKHEKGIKPSVIRRELEIKSLSTVCDIIKLYKETGSFVPRPLNNGAKPKITPQDKLAMRAKILEQPDITLEELKEELNLPICISRICRIINNELKLPYKKNAVSIQAKPSGRS